MQLLDDPSAKYILLQQVIYLWITFIALVLLIKHRIPNRTIHNIVNVSLALATVIEFIAIIVVSVTMQF